MLAGQYFLCYETSVKIPKSQAEVVPGVANAYNMVHIAQCELQQFVREYAPGVCKAK